MSEVAQTLLPIDLRLRFALFGLECALGVTFSAGECERVFQDTANRVSAKNYVFFESARLAVIGRVDEYEPETIWVEVRGARAAKELLARVAKASSLN